MIVNGYDITPNANLIGANLSDANLSDADNLLSQIKYLKSNFEFTKKGIVVYKSFHENYTPNKKWSIENNKIINEVCNFSRTNECACGINFGTLEWCKYHCSQQIWECLIEWEWVAGICVPYNTDGKCRCEKLRLIKKI